MMKIMSVRTRVAVLGLQSVIWLTSCATPLKTEQIRARIEPGASAADTLLTLGMPDSQQVPQADRRVLIYFDTGIYFVADKLVYIFNTGEQSVASLAETEKKLAAEWKEIPDIRHKIAFGEKQTAPVNAYRAFYYLGDEEMFREAIRRKINPEGYSADLNAMCLAIRGGFTAAVKELLAINVRTDLLINDHRAGKSVIRVSDCVWLQENKELAAQYTEMIKAHEQALAAAEPQTSRPGVQQAPDPEAAKKKSAINWDEVKEWLKPQVPAAPGERGTPQPESESKTAPNTEPETKPDTQD